MGKNLKKLDIWRDQIRVTFKNPDRLDVREQGIDATITVRKGNDFPASREFIVNIVLGVRENGHSDRVKFEQKLHLDQVTRCGLVNLQELYQWYGMGDGDPFNFLIGFVVMTAGEVELGFDNGNVVLILTIGNHRLYAYPNERQIEKYFVIS